jgi:hypothetical protein
VSLAPAKARLRALYASAVEILREVTADYRADLIAHDVIPDARSKAERN